MYAPIVASSTIISYQIKSIRMYEKFHKKLSDSLQFITNKILVKVYGILSWIRRDIN